MKIWFQNRRAKERKQGKKRDELKIKDPNAMMAASQLQVTSGGLVPTKVIFLLEFLKDLMLQFFFVLTIITISL